MLTEFARHVTVCFGFGRQQEVQKDAKKKKKLLLCDVHRVRARLKQKNRQTNNTVVINTMYVHLETATTTTTTRQRYNKKKRLFLTCRIVPNTRAEDQQKKTAHLYSAAVKNRCLLTQIQNAKLPDLFSK